MSGKNADRLVDDGLAAHQRGDLAAAAAAYRRALDKAPRHADALHLLGLVEYQSGRHAAAAELIGKAAAISGVFAPYHANLALAQQELGDLAAAERSLLRALELDAGYLEARHNLAALRKRQGRLGDAEAGFRAVLQLNPDYIESHRQLGLLLLEQGRALEALAHLTRVVAADPGDSGALNNVAVALRALGRTGEALAYQQAAVNQAPRDPVTLGNLAGAYFEAGAMTQAADLYAQALALDGRNAGLLNNFAMTLQAMGRVDDAEACFEAAAAADPTYAGPLDNLGTLLMLRGKPAQAAARHRAALAIDPLHANAWNNLGNAQAAAGDKAAAFKSWRNALTLRPDQAEAWTNLGVGLAGAESFAAAAAVLRRALRLNADSAAGWNNLGDALRLEAAPSATAGRYARAAALEPDYAEAWSNLGLAAQRGGDMAKGERLFDRAVRINPELAGARFNRGLLRLEVGRLGEGWPDYAYRFASGKVGKGRAPAAPPWRGEALRPGEKLLVWREQGLGDEILFASMYAELLDRGVEAIFECDARLVGMLSRALPAGANVLVRAQTIDAAGNETLAAPDYARHVPAGSLARLLRGRLADFPVRPAWLAADPARVADFRRRLDAAAPGRLRVGVAWRSQLMTAERRAAYLRLDDLAPLFALAGVAFVNLQYGDVEEEIADAEKRLGVRLLRWPDLDLKDDLEGAAALTAALDLVIAPAVSSAELAAALGAPTWRLGGRDWTGAGTAVRPWTPTVRAFAPKTGEKDLAGLIGRVAGELKGLAPSAACAPSRGALPDPRRLVNAGSAALARDDRKAAGAAAAAALALAPDMVEALTLAGGAGLAPAWRRRALAVSPGHGTALVNMGRAQAADGDWSGALATLRRAAAVSPDRAAAYVNLCHVLRFQGATGAAFRAADRALALDPGQRAAEASRALLRLAAGDLAGGWDDYGARSRLETPAPPLETLRGRLVEVVAEQGLGDEILFASCLSDLLAVAGRVRLVCDRRLVGLFARRFPGLEVRPHRTPAGEAADLAIMAGDLPRLFRRRLGDFPTDPPPLLTADPARVERWRRVLAAAPGLKIGIAWTSGLEGAERAACRTRLVDWAPLAALPGATLVNLQYGEVEKEMAAAEAVWGREILRWPGLDLRDDLEEAAALCVALDLVVAVPTAACELAAAVGAPTWRLTPPGDWTLLGAAARPWFPGQMIVRSPPGGDLAAAVRVAARFLMAV